MKEIEVKIINIDKDKIINRLLDLKAERIFEGPMKSVYFDFGKDNSCKTLRVRQKGDKAFITLKFKSKN